MIAMRSLEVLHAVKFMKKDYCIALFMCLFSIKIGNWRFSALVTIRNSALATGAPLPVAMCSRVRPIRKQHFVN